MLAEQRQLVRQLIDHQTRPQATAELAVRPSQASLFKMRDPPPFCEGSAELERFLGQLKMNFKLHRHQFPGGDSDKVQYAMGLFRTWLEHPDESQRKSKVTHPAEWANRLVLSQSASLNDLDRFEKELREVYGDRDRQLNAAFVAYGEMAKGYHDSDESVRDFESPIRSNWRDAGWHADDDSELGQRMLYDLIWVGLRPAIRARIRPFAGKNGRFDTVEELFEKAHEVEVKPNRDRCAQSAERHGTSGGKDKKRLYAGRDTALAPTPAPQPSSSGSRDTPNRQSGRSKLPPALWVDQYTWDNRRDRGLCTRCGDKHLTSRCTK
jgi:hypothetical protein